MSSTQVKRKKVRGVHEVSPIDVYRLLPGTNCGECGEANCMAYAARLVNGEYTLENCPPLNEENNKKLRISLGELTAPPVREISFGDARSSIKIGGKHVLFRHEFTYHNPVPIAIDVEDSLSGEEIVKRVNSIENFLYNYIGREMRLDAIAIRDTTGEPERFANAVRIAREHSDKPLILCTYNPKVMEKAISLIPDSRPLLYAATTENWKEMAEIALNFSSPLVVSSPGDMGKLLSLATTLEASGVPDLVLDPGTFLEEDIAITISNFTALRTSVFRDGSQNIGYPLLGTPITAWAGEDLSPEVSAWREAWAAPVLMSRYADLLIMHSLEGWALLPALLWRFNLYTDPRKPVAVDAGIRPVGSPGKGSPVFITTNYALTFFTVESDVKSAEIDCYLLVVDTGGLSVESAVAGRYLNPSSIAEAINGFCLSDLVDHRKIIIPGLAARISGDTEEVTGWEVLVGPKDSSGIPLFLRNRWNNS